MRLPRHVADKRLFCGTALVEFSTQEEADKILNQSLVYGGVQLELNSKLVYLSPLHGIYHLLSIYF